MPTLLLKVSTLNVVPFILKALVSRVRFKLAMPEVEVKFRAPVDKVNPFWAVKVPPDVTVPVPVAEILPDVVTSSPVKAGDSVVPILDHSPDWPLDEPTPILPVHVSEPVVSSIVHPVDPDPPAILTNPPDPGFKFRLVPGIDAPIPIFPDPEKVRAVEVKVLVLIVELKVAAPATVKVPLLLKATAPAPEVVKLYAPNAMSVEASKVIRSLNWAKSNELSAINPPGRDDAQEPLPEASEVRI